MSSKQSQSKGGRKDGKSSGGGSGLTSGDEDILQAVVIADSFDSRFQPLTSDTPRCLLPLCNVPLIEYTFEMLVLSEVKEIYVLACAHADQVRSYIKTSKWGKHNSLVKIQVIVTQQLLSLGDALREVDAKSIIRSDFILISADTVANVKLQEAVLAHKNRRKTNKDAIMTMMVQESSPHHPSKQPEFNPVYVLDANTKECVYYEHLDAYPPRKELTIPSDSLAKLPRKEELEIRCDLLDCFIDICSVEVPALFTENFDYQHLRKDFVHGVLTSDLLGKSIHCHILGKSYAARVSGPKMYDSISRDVLGRWAYPFVPDSNLLEGTSYTYGRRQVYKEAGVKLSRSCTLERRLAVGAGTVLGADTRLRDSVVGRNCKVGADVILEGAYIFDGVEIGDGCVVKNTIIGKGAKLLEGVTVGPGSIIGNGCIVGPSKTIPPFTKITATLNEDSETSDDSEAETSAPIYGNQAFEWVDEFSDDSGDEDQGDLQYNFMLTQLGRTWKDLPVKTPEEEELSEEEAGDVDVNSNGELDEEEARALEFEREARFTVERAFKEGLTVDNALLELTALRMSYNAQFIQVREAVIPQLLRHLDPAKPLASALKSILSKWSALISKFTLSEYDMIDAIDILMASCADHSAQPAKLFTLGLSQLYDLDILAEDAILTWYDTDDADRLADRPNEYKLLRTAAKPFIDWLSEAEEEDSD